MYDQTLENSVDDHFGAPSDYVDCDGPCGFAHDPENMSFEFVGDEEKRLCGDCKAKLITPEKTCTECGFVGDEILRGRMCEHCAELFALIVGGVTVKGAL